MSTRLLHFRFAFAVLAVAALIAGALLENVWLTGPGVVAAGISEVIGLLQARLRFNLPIERAFQGASDSLPALGVAAFEPFAVGVTIAVVIFALMSNGMDTVKMVKVRDGRRRITETLRCVLTGFASLSLLWIPLAATSKLNLGARLGLTPWAAAGIAFVVAGGVGAIALVDSLISVKAASADSSGGDAPNVDT